MLTRRITRACEAAVVLAWFLFVLRYQYRVAWLEPYDLTLDAVFIGAVASAIVARAAERRGPAAAGGLVARTAVVVVVTAATLVMAEYAARFAFRSARSSGNARSFVAQRGGGVAVRFNALGFRDRDVPPRDGRYRIIVVGDSFTFGQGVEEEARFSDLLEHDLGPRYEVFNFGRSGNNMPEHLEVLEQALKNAPDFVLLQLYINDFETPSMQRPSTYPLLPEPANTTLERRSILYDLAGSQWAALQERLGIVDSYVRYMKRNLEDPNAPNAREAFGHLREFFERARQAGVGVGAVLFPAPDAMGRFGAGYPFGFIHERVAGICRDEHVPCLDLLPAFSTIRDPHSMWVSPFDAHPNAMANRRAAFEILKAFGPAWQH